MSLQVATDEGQEGLRIWNEWCRRWDWRLWYAIVEGASLNAGLGERDEE